MAEVAGWGTHRFHKGIPTLAIGTATEPLYAFPAALLANEYSLFSPFIQGGSSYAVTLAIQTLIAHEQEISPFINVCPSQVLYISK